MRRNKCENQDSDDEGRGGECGKPATHFAVSLDNAETVMLCQECADRNAVAAKEQRWIIKPLEEPC